MLLTHGIRGYLEKYIRGEDPGLFILRGWMTLKVLEYPGSTIYLIIYHI